MIGASVIAATIFVVTWLVSCCLIGPGPFNMDPHGIPGAFEAHLKRYQGGAQLLITLATASVAYLVNFLLGLKKGEPLNVYASALIAACPFVVTLLGYCVIFSFGFILLESLAYERYAHRTSPESTYTRPWYATNLALGYSSVGAFVVAYGRLAFAVLSAR